MFQVQCLKSKINKTTEFYSKYSIGPFLKGQSITVGNALRRVLLSNLQGLAITGVRITGIDHEFSTIQNVKEDVVFKNKIGRIRDIKIHPGTGKIYFLSQNALWLMEKN